MWGRWGGACVWFVCLESPCSSHFTWKMGRCINCLQYYHHCYLLYIARQPQRKRFFSCGFLTQAGCGGRAHCYCPSVGGCQLDRYLLPLVRLTDGTSGQRGDGLVQYYLTVTATSATSLFRVRTVRLLLTPPRHDPHGHQTVGTIVGSVLGVGVLLAVGVTAAFW